MTYIFVIIAAVCGFILGRVCEAWARTQFIHSLMPSDSGHSDVVEASACDCGSGSYWGEAQRAGYRVVDARLDRVRRGAQVFSAHTQGDI